MKLNSDRKRAYTKPTMRVYELQHRTMILAGSGGVGATNSIDGWIDGGSDNEDIYM